MEIQGPVAVETQPTRTWGPRAALGGCVSGCSTVVAGAALLVTSAVGFAFEAVQPHHRDTVTATDGQCQLEWWRSALGGARYRIRCVAEQELVLESFKLLSGPEGVTLVESIEDWGQPPWEDQRPLSGEVVTVSAGRIWVYDGSISMGPVPWVGPSGSVTLTLLADEEPIRLHAVESGTAAPSPWGWP